LKRQLEIFRERIDVANKQATDQLTRGLDTGRTEMKEVIVTGGAGFTGTNVVSYYLDRGYRVVVFDNLSRKGGLNNIEWLQQNSNANNLELLIGDARFPPVELQAAVERADAVFHYAAQVAVTDSVTDPRHDFECNALSTFNMLELIRNSAGKKPPLFYSSTNKVYGGMEDVATEEGEKYYYYRDFPDGIAENRLLDFHSPYGCSKGCADQYVRDYARIYGLQTVVFRQSCIYGYRQFGVEDQGWVAWFIIAAVLGKPLTIYGDGKQVRDVLFIDDLINAFDAAWNRIETIGGSVYNIGGGPENTISLLQLLDFLEEEMNLPTSPGFDDWRPGDQPVYVSNISKAKEEFDWEPKVDWKAGVGKLVGWVRDNKDMLERLF
jgi:CDP-paratose 2-epimerase